MLHEYNALEQDLARYSKSIGHPARIAILLAIVKHGNIVEKKIIDIPPLEKRIVIRHLDELKKAGMIHGKVVGAHSHYSVDLDQMRQFAETFYSFINTIKNATTN